MITKFKFNININEELMRECKCIDLTGWLVQQVQVSMLVKSTWTGEVSYWRTFLDDGTELAKRSYHSEHEVDSLAIAVGSSLVLAASDNRRIIRV